MSHISSKIKRPRPEKQGISSLKINSVIHTSIGLRNKNDAQLNKSLSSDRNIIQSTDQKQNVLNYTRFIQSNPLSIQKHPFNFINPQTQFKNIQLNVSPTLIQQYSYRDIDRKDLSKKRYFPKTNKVADSEIMASSKNEHSTILNETKTRRKRKYCKRCCLFFECSFPCVLMYLLIVLLVVGTVMGIVFGIFMSLKAKTTSTITTNRNMTSVSTTPTTTITTSTNTINNTNNNSSNTTTSNSINNTSNPSTTTSISISTSSISDTSTSSATASTTSSSTSTSATTTNICISGYTYATQLLYLNLTTTLPWTQYIFNYTSPNVVASKLTFSFRNDPGFWFLDAVSVTNSSGQQLLTNSGFELGTLASWVYCNPKNATYAGSIYSASSYSGVYSYSDGSVGSADYLSQTFNGLPYDVFTIKFWLGATGTSNVSAWITVYS